MSDALIRNVDEQLLDAYRAEARANRRSLQAELKAGLERGRPRRRLSMQEKVALSDRLRRMSPASASDSTDYLRWLRDTNGGDGSGPDDPIEPA